MLKDAYEATMEFLRHRRVDYKLAFGGPAGQAVLRDLMHFCRANDTCFHPDPRMHAVLEGRREVWLRIQKHLHLTTEELYQVQGGVTLNLMEDKDV